MRSGFWVMGLMVIGLGVLLTLMARFVLCILPIGVLCLFVGFVIFAAGKHSKDTEEYENDG